MLKGKIALVTGASSGIGRATALVMARCGARVALVGRDGDALREVSAGIRESGSEGVPLIADLTKDSDLEKVVGDAVAAFGALDILVNAAGTIANGTL
jgi:citronellol/citronellal dehydrogenase